MTWNTTTAILTALDDCMSNFMTVLTFCDCLLGSNLGSYSASRGVKRSRSPELHYDPALGVHDDGMLYHGIILHLYAAESGD
jgi:hypothetical protein